MIICTEHYKMMTQGCEEVDLEFYAISISYRAIVVSIWKTTMQWKM